MVANFVQISVMFGVFSLCLHNRGMISAFGYKFESDFIYLMVFSTLYSPTDFIAKFPAMYLTRRCEYAADNYAVHYNHGENLKSSLISLFKKNKGPLTADPLYSAHNHSHPTLVERLHNIDDQLRKKK